MRTFVVLAVLAVPILAMGDRPPQSTAAPAAAPYSQQQLQRLRQSLVAQIAVYDAGETAMRAPTPGEAAALAVSSPGAIETVALDNGGLALRTGASQLSFAVAERADDGTIRISDRGPREGRDGGLGKGGAHVR